MPTYSVSNVNIGTTANDGSGDPIRSAFLKINQIQSTIHYTPAHKHTFYKNSKFKIPNLINTDYIFDRIISLPMHNHLSIKDVKRICKLICKFFKQNA